MRGKARSDLEEAIAELAERQHGKVSRRQLLRLGLGSRAIEYRLAGGWLRADHRGVYSLGHRAESHQSRWMAAVLYAGDGAVLSWWSAASLLRMRPGSGPVSHVTCRRRRASTRRIRIHHARLPPDEATVEQGIPVTTQARTLLDLAPLLPSPTLGRMIDAAPPHDGAHLAELLARYPRKPGAPKLRALLGNERPMTRSDFEAHVLHLIDHAGLPRPDVNVVVEGHEVDLVWWDVRVIAEIDTYVTHGSRLAFELDRERDRKLATKGWRVVRITDSDPRDGVADLGRVLEHKKGRPR